MNISLRLLRYVVAAADCGNVTEAARRLQVSQPSVSAAIAELEQMLNVTIFVRHHAKGVTLTSAGQRLIDEARKLLKHADEFSKTAEALGDGARGEVALACCPLLAARYMPSLILEFSKRYPLITLRLEEGSQESMINDLAQGRIEMAICYDLGIPANFDTRKLLSLPPMIALPGNHRLSRAQDVSLSEVVEEPFILYDFPYIGDYCLSLFSALKLDPNIAARLRSFELIRGLVAKGQGYTIQLVRPLLPTTTYDGGHVTLKPLRDTVPTAQVICATQSAQLVRPAVSIFAEFIQSAFDRDVYDNGSRQAASAA